jgi:hypothetical protein
VTPRAIIVTGFVVLLVIILAALIFAHARKERIATIWPVIDYLTRKRAVKVVAVLIWAWLGWHFLAR